MSSPRLASVPESHATRGCCVPTRRATTMQRRHQSGLHCELGSVPQSETVNDDLNSALIEAVERPEVQIANKSVREHLPPCILVRQRAQAGNLWFTTPQPSNMLHDGCHTRQEGGLIGRCEWTVGVRERGRHNHMRNGCGSSLVARLVGKAVSAADAIGPHRDLISARTLSVRVGHNCSLRCCSSKHPRSVPHPQFLTAEHGAGLSVLPLSTSQVNPNPPKENGNWELALVPEWFGDTSTRWCRDALQTALSTPGELHEARNSPSLPRTSTTRPNTLACCPSGIRWNNVSCSADFSSN